MFYLLFRDKYLGERIRTNECKENQQFSYNQSQNGFKDIVTVSSGPNDASYQQPSQKLRDNNYQILSVAGMHALSLDQNPDTKKVCARFENDSKKEVDIDTSSSTSSSGQQVQFLAHL